MNQLNTPSSGEMRSPVWPSARAFLAVRHVHITSSTIITTLTKFTSDTTLLPESFTCDDNRLASSTRPSKAAWNAGCRRTNDSPESNGIASR